MLMSILTNYISIFLLELGKVSMYMVDLLLLLYPQPFQLSEVMCHWHLPLLLALMKRQGRILALLCQVT